MTTAEIIKQMEKEFEKKWCKDKSSGFISPFCHIDDIYEFASKLSRTLLESFGEEVCPEWIDNPYGEVTNYSVGRRDERKAIRLKVKEILSNLK